MIKTRGPDRHLVLRGGGSGSNDGPAEVARAAQEATGITRGVLVDCPTTTRQGPHPAGTDLREVLGQFGAGQDALMGLLIQTRPG